MHRTFSLASFCLTALAAAAAYGQAARRPIVLDDLARLRTVADPQRSPEGTWVAYTVTSVDVEKDKTNTDIWMSRWDGSQHVQLTSSPDREATPRFSPDGRYLAFLATRGDEDEKKKGGQVWLLDRAGGEAVRLTDIQGGVSDYAWSPDGQRLALIVSPFDPDSEPEKKEGWKRKTPPPLVLERYQFKEDREGYLKGLYALLGVFELSTKKLEVLTRDQTDPTAPAWSPDGQWLAFRSKRAHADPDRTSNHDLFVIAPKAGAEPRQLTTTLESEEGRPVWSPSGQTIAILVGDEDRYGAYDLTKLALVPAAGGTPQILTATLDRPVSDVAWTADGTALVFTFDDNRATHLGRVRATGGPVESLTNGRRVVRDPSLGTDGGLAVVASTPHEIPEIWAFENGDLRPISRQNEALAAELTLGTTEDLRSTSVDGTEVHSLLTKPAGYSEGTKYPTLLHIHGGPNSQDDYEFDFSRELFAAAGYVVIEVNYRGSSGRGAAFQKAIFADWGNKEVEDLLGAVDEAVRTGIADPERLGLGGWSYGGILTNYTITRTPRFKAAVSGAGSLLQTSMYGSDQYIVQYEAELGRPWEQPEAWSKVSAAYLAIGKVTTPTLFLCGEKDFNVPIAGSEQMYQALESLGISTQLVVYPGQFHGLTIPSYQRDRLERYLGWWNRYLQAEKTPAKP